LVLGTTYSGYETYTGTGNKVPAGATAIYTSTGQLAGYQYPSATQEAKKSSVDELLISGKAQTVTEAKAMLEAQKSLPPGTTDAEFIFSGPKSPVTPRGSILTVRYTEPSSDYYIESGKTQIGVSKGVAEKLASESTIKTQTTKSAGFYEGIIEATGPSIQPKGLNLFEQFLFSRGEKIKAGAYATITFIPGIIEFVKNISEKGLLQTGKEQVEAVKTSYTISPEWTRTMLGTQLLIGKGVGTVLKGKGVPTETVGITKTDIVKRYGDVGQFVEAESQGFFVSKGAYGVKGETLIKGVSHGEIIPKIVQAEGKFIPTEAQALGKGEFITRIERPRLFGLLGKETRIVKGTYEDIALGGKETKGFEPELRYSKIEEKGKKTPIKSQTLSQKIIDEEGYKVYKSVTRPGKVRSIDIVRDLTRISEEGGTIIREYPKPTTIQKPFLFATKDVVTKIQKNLVKEAETASSGEIAEATTLTTTATGATILKSPSLTQAQFSLIGTIKPKTSAKVITIPQMDQLSERQRKELLGEGSLSVETNIEDQMREAMSKLKVRPVLGSKYETKVASIPTTIQNLMPMEGYTTRELKKQITTTTKVKGIPSFGRPSEETKVKPFIPPESFITERKLTKRKIEPFTKGYIEREAKLLDPKKLLKMKL